MNERNDHNRHNDRDYNGHDRSPEHIEQDIRRTRHEMDETLDALGDALQPRRIASELWTAVTGNAIDSRTAACTVRDVGRSVSSRVASHPIPAALIGAGLIWLISDRGHGSHHAAAHAADAAATGASRAGHAATRVGHAATGAARATGSAASNAARSAGHAASSAAGGIASGAKAAGSAASHAAESAWHAGESAFDSAAHASRRAVSTAAHSAERAAEATQEAYEERPLAFGVAALAVGLAAGLLIPDSRRERAMFGKAGQRLRHGAADAGAHAGTELADAARDTAAELTDAARSAAAHGIDRVTDAVEHQLDRAEKAVEDEQDKHQRREQPASSAQDR